MTNGITFRPITDGDTGFLRALYASTRADEMAAVPWTEPEKVAFLNVQFEVQHRYYQEVFPDAEFSIVEKPRLLRPKECARLHHSALTHLVPAAALSPPRQVAALRYVDVPPS